MRSTLPTGFLLSFSLLSSLLQCALCLSGNNPFGHHHQLQKREVGRCRNLPGDPRFPTACDWSALNSTIGGRLQAAVPFAKFCQTQKGGTCTPEQIYSALFRKTVPGAMNQVS